MRIGRGPMDALVGAASRIAGALRRRARPAPPAPVVRLDDVRRRLELLLAAVYGRSIPITAAETPVAGGWLARVAKRAPRADAADAIATSDGERITLPRTLDASEGDDAAIARFRLMAIEQAERLARGTAALVPGDDTPLERDLYLLGESAAVDGAIARAIPGIVAQLAAARAAALAERPAMESLGAAEREVESLLRGQLAADAALSAQGLAADGTPADSLAWARATAERIRRASVRYEGLPPVAPWGIVRPPRTADGAPVTAIDEPPQLSGSRHGLMRRAGGPGAGGNAGRSGRTVAPSATPSVQPPDVASAPRDAPPAAQAASESSAESAQQPQTGERETATGSGTPGPPDGSVASAPASGATEAPEAESDDGVRYPEWDYRVGRYEVNRATVRPWPPSSGDAAWAAAVLERQAPVFRRLRERFERLRARRTRLGQQRHGDELDLAACVRAIVDQRTGHSVDDRLYVAVRPARREIAIALLVDISGSTHEFVDGAQRVIDVEKVALLLASEALDALGDRYTILTFSGKGRHDVRLRTVKDFAERNGGEVRRRIAALEPEGYTRAGAAIRHATALLSQQRAGHRLLLMLSDGKPNDEDAYAGRFAVEDARQAIAEARADGVFPFCLTVDREGRDYLSRIFGSAGHTILRRPEQLPTALVRLVRQLLATA